MLAFSGAARSATFDDKADNTSEPAPSFGESAVAVHTGLELTCYADKRLPSDRLAAELKAPPDLELRHTG